jgi:TetR/AcrR family transcriptional regulator
VAHPAPRTCRAERTRGAILQAAEAEFAERGYAATRLEDIAESVGIRRASMVYHFRDKRQIYEAVLAEVLCDFESELSTALASTGGLLERIEAGVGAWVDYVGRRPSLARIVLRELADGSATPAALLDEVQPIVDLVEKFRSETRNDPLAKQAPIDPVHLASAVVGTTVFFIAAMPNLVPAKAFDPLNPKTLAMHRREVLRITRLLLGADPDHTPTAPKESSR